MLGLIFSLATVSVVAGLNLQGVDPNTLSCDPAGQVFLLLPHFTDCNKFYMCVHGNEVEFSCSAPTLIFDFEIQDCAWDWATTCKLRTKPVEEVSSEESSEESPEASPEESPEASSEEGSGDESLEGSGDYEEPVTDDFGRTIIDCSDPIAASTQVPYNGDCQRYWRCIDGKPHTVYCSDGLYFNDRTQQCDYEANVNCQVEQQDELKGEFMAY